MKLKRKVYIDTLKLSFLENVMEWNLYNILYMSQYLSNVYVRILCISKSVVHFCED